MYAADPRGMKRPEADKSLEALFPVLSGAMPVVFNANTEREIIRALDLAKEFKLNAVIAGGQEAWKVAGRLKEQNVPVLLSLTRSDRVRLDPSKTSGDYARELRARGSAAYQPFRAFSRRFDVAVFGHGGCDAALIEDLRRLAAPLAPRARAA